MARAFREGVDSSRRLRAPVRRRTWKPMRDLQGLTQRTTTTGSEMGPLVDVPAMVRIENEHWVFERIEEGVLYNLTHRLVVQEEAGPKTIGACEDMKTAMTIASQMAEREGRIVMIQPL